MRKRTLRETLLDNQKAEQGWANMFGKPLRDMAPIPAARVKKIKTSAQLAKEVPTESREQILFVTWFERQYPTVRIFAIPNGGNRDMITGSIMRREGVRRGVPDLFVPELALFIEFKRQKGSSISPEQRDWEKYLKSVGYLHFFAYGFDDAVTKLKEITNDEL